MVIILEARIHILRREWNIAFRKIHMMNKGARGNCGLCGWLSNKSIHEMMKMDLLRANRDCDIEIIIITNTKATVLWYIILLWPDLKIIRIIHQVQQKLSW